MISERDGLGIRKWHSKYFVPTKLIQETQVLCDAYDVNMSPVTQLSEYWRTLHIAHFFTGKDLIDTGKDITPKLEANLTPKYSL